MVARDSIATEDVVVIRTDDLMVVLREKVRFGASSNLLLRAAAYETIRHRTVMPLQQIKENEMEISTQRMVRMPNKYGEGKLSRMNPESSTGLYVNASVESEWRMISQNWKIQEEEKEIASKVSTF